MTSSGEPVLIHSVDNPLVRDLRAIARSSNARRQSAVALLDGAHLIAAAADAGYTLNVLAASEQGLAKAEIRQLFERTQALRCVVFADRIFDQISSLASPSGLLGLLAVPANAPLTRLAGDALVLDRIQDSGNVGTILRTSAAVGCRRVLATTGTAFLWSPKVLRAAMGAHFSLRLHEEVALESLAGEPPASVLIADGSGEADLFETDLRGPTVWIFGNEGAGVGAAARSLPHRSIRLPMAVGVESLNVAAAVAICLYEQFRQRRVADRAAG